MRSSTADRIKGKVRETSGTVKEKAGRSVGNPRVEGKGAGEKAAGKVQRKVGQIKRVFGR